ncbi:hypothetical protein [Dictyobacter kobayashii]|uniref:Uncharacterized protein n=1 Tax=Dictyobacter kobayashii TaxID=2014872 RepID=A0A402APP7_9CHLR|nr:hypothetical protein [Dictyobacter kobayashii]GCE21072.1 hypothetical protein KDK_48720 [Dictyobacter kobayashii]
MVETQSQQVGRISQQLDETKAYLEQDLAAATDITLKRIELDAATVVTLTLVSELLPEQIQKQVKELITLHEQVWNMDMPPVAGTTPRKPLGERLFHRFAFFLHGSPNRGNTSGIPII